MKSLPYYGDEGAKRQIASKKRVNDRCLLCIALVKSRKVWRSWRQ